jgi:TRAP-type C4-dicarboxylate transport system substrate-binding protein
MTAIGAIRRINMSAAHTRIAIAIAALACALGALPASAADFVMKFGTATINETQHQFIKFYKDEVEKA